MSKEKPNLKLMQKRLTYTAITASTLRKQGPAGTIKAARKYLQEFNLDILSDINTEEQFNIILDGCTIELMKSFPDGARTNWGAARKAINIFLEEVFYNRFLCEKFNLSKLGCFLEVPLDNDVAMGLISEVGGSFLPEWEGVGIKYLKPNDSKRFQDAAKEIANRDNVLRVFLDLKYWKNE